MGTQFASDYVRWDGGWKPESVLIAKKPPADEPPAHHKITTWTQVRVDPSSYHYWILPRVTAPWDITETAWEAEPHELDVISADGKLILKKKGEKFGAYMKLPRGADWQTAPTVTLPDRGGLYVTVPKLGRTEPPFKLTNRYTGGGPKEYTFDGKPCRAEDLAPLTPLPGSKLAFNAGTPIVGKKEGAKAPEALTPVSTRSLPPMQKKAVVVREDPKDVAMREMVMLHGAKKGGDGLLGVGKRVLVHGLKHTPQYSNQAGIITHKDEKSGRWSVYLPNWCTSITPKSDRLVPLD